MIALGQAGDPGADLGDHAGTFMSAEHRHERHRATAGDDVRVGMAQARGGQFHLDLTGGWFAEVDLTNRPGCADLLDDSSLNFHQSFSSRVTGHRFGRTEMCITIRKP